METLRSNVNNTSNYPDKETMELFLKIWNSKWILSNWKNSEWISCYDNVNAVVTLAVVCDYLCQKWREEEKQAFLEEIERQGDMYYKTIWELALKIWEQKWDLTPFSKSMINSNRERLQIKDRTRPYFPVIVKSDFSKRIENIDYKKMIHEEFESELDRLNWINEWADKIQAETENHQFDRWDNSHQINDLENKL